MSEEDQIILTSYANLTPVIKLLSIFNTSVIPTSNPSKQPQQAFTLVWCSGAHHSRRGVLSQSRVITPPMGLCGKYSLTLLYCQLVMASVLWPIGSFWCFMAFGPYHLSLATYGLRPYPATIGPFSQFSTSPTPRPVPLFCAWGVHLAFQGLEASSAITRAFGPTPLNMGSNV
ncbi:hypothetical protein O181_100466 [Austropuccinia psidii MF-1]|uniref:Uncharacterized protein n=1 Tax=Austropuccinia psidii MF-1 TaxID=1389203 RepID=A0A9Q3PHU0_9BASI|nr:hypothetical protein [Austropuccinia psidii MF-1]